MLSLFINWHVNPDIIKIGEFAIRWYGLFFVFAFYFGYLIVQKIFIREGYKTELLDKLTMYMLISTIVGARLGHCLLYQPDFYLKHPLEILQIWHGGLASHGAAIGILLGLLFFVLKHKEISFLWVVDRVVIVVALSGFFIRMGNLMNSEIVGKPSNGKLAFVFQRNDQDFPKFIALWNKGSVDLKWKKVAENIAVYDVEKSYDQKIWTKLGHVRMTDTNRNLKTLTLTDNQLDQTDIFYKLKANEITVSIIEFVPRYPTQIMEATCYLLLFLYLIGLYYRKGAKLRAGYLFGVFLTVLFTIRFLLEFLKENQVEFEKNLVLNMGQLLSIPFILIGIVLLIILSGKRDLPIQAPEEINPENELLHGGNQQEE